MNSDDVKEDTWWVMVLPEQSSTWNRNDHKRVTPEVRLVAEKQGHTGAMIPSFHKSSAAQKLPLQLQSITSTLSIDIRAFL